MPLVQTLLPVTFRYSLCSEAVVMRQLRRWKRLWRRSLTCGLPWGLPEVVGTVQQAGGDYFERDKSFRWVLSIKVPIRKKVCTCCIVPTISGSRHGPLEWSCQWPSSQHLSSDFLTPPTTTILNACRKKGWKLTEDTTIINLIIYCQILTFTIYSNFRAGSVYMEVNYENKSASKKKTEKERKVDVKTFRF